MTTNVVKGSSHAFQSHFNFNYMHISSPYLSFTEQHIIDASYSCCPTIAAGIAKNVYRIGYAIDKEL